MSTHRYFRLATAKELIQHGEHYDYTHQAWVGTDGRYLSCAHPSTMHCTCYGKMHAGELAPVEHERLPQDGGAL